MSDYDSKIIRKQIRVYGSVQDVYKRQALLIVAIALGLNFPMYLNLSVWHIIIFVYILIASVTPVWRCV